ncbi:MAG TPA: hypothetical protein VFT74_02815 [Isosphaeraceae bacterium]|nr:hypothetical protein [Isosphaeraceae bacterium]
MPNRGTSAGSFATSAEAKTPKGKFTVKATNQTLVTANEGRVSLYVFNPSAKEVWLAFGETAVAKEGIWLKKEVGSVYIPDYKGIVACITTEGEGEISFVEV